MYITTPILDGHIGNYPKVNVSWLDENLDIFAVPIFMNVYAGPEEIMRISHIFPMERTKSGISVARKYRSFLPRSRAIVLGTEKSDDLHLVNGLTNLKRRYDLDGVLYMGLNKKGFDLGNRYINHDNTESRISDAVSA